MGLAVRLGATPAPSLPRNCSYPHLAREFSKRTFMLTRTFKRSFAVLRRVTAAVSDRVRTECMELGQTTAEYALVILGAAALATLLITWATKSHAIGSLFDKVIGKVIG